MTNKRTFKPSRRLSTARAASGDHYRTSRTVAKRTDLFVADDGDYDDIEETTTEIRYASGRASGPITWLITEAHGAPLDAHALALFAALTELYLDEKTKRIRMKSGEVRIVVDTTARKLVEMIYGHGHHATKEYAALGLLKEQLTAGGLQRLFGVAIRKGSSWIHPRTGRRMETMEAFRLVDWVRRKTIGAVDHLQIALGSPIQEELINGGVVRLPIAVVQALGPKRATALRLATHVLGQEVMDSGAREIGLAALAAIIQPSASRDPVRYPGRYRGYVAHIVEQIQAVDPDRKWSVEPAKTDPLGKVVCRDKNGRADEHHSENTANPTRA